MDGGTGAERPHAAHVSAYLNSPAGCVDAAGAPLEPNLDASIDPSMGLGQRVIKLVARRDIDVGEELFFAYGPLVDKYLELARPPRRPGTSAEQAEEVAAEDEDEGSCSEDEVYAELVKLGHGSL
mmetsp:Transcript_73296/g.237378  ORF Transcript_73296/g.237378 Transcript_73296/m.237378 type:complete len:125 (+) Transcript_73296:1941-2315(+)